MHTAQACLSYTRNEIENKININGEIIFLSESDNNNFHYFYGNFLRQH